MTVPDHAPDYRHGYLRIPLAVWSALYCHAPLTRRQLQLTSSILRESWGWQTKDGQVYLWTRPLSVRQFSAATGLATDHLSQDLRELVTRGILREQGRRYQLVPDPRLWKTRATRAPKRRSLALKSPGGAAKSAVSPSVLKKANKDQRNVRARSKSELSTVGDNSAPQRSVSAKEPGRPRHPLLSHRGSGTADRLAPLVESFVGPLSSAEAEALRAWIEAAGVVAVWDSLEPFFRQGRRVTRHHLRRLLTEAIGRHGDTAATLPDEDAHV